MHSSETIELFPIPNSPALWQIRFTLNGIQYKSRKSYVSKRDAGIAAKKLKKEMNSIANLDLSETFSVV